MEHLPEELKLQAKDVMKAAWRMDPEEGKKRIRQQAHQLDKKYPLAAKRLKRKEDRLIAKHKRTSRYFRTCPARQYYEIKHGIPCNY